MKLSRHHANDLPRDVVEGDPAANSARITTKLRLPESIAQNYRPAFPREFIAGSKPAPKLGTYSQHGHKVRGHSRCADPDGIALAAVVHAGIGGQRSPLESAQT